MNHFTESIEQREAGTRLLETSGNLYKLASESESMSEILELTLKALNKDIEALSLILESTIAQKAEVKELRESWEKELKNLETEILDIKP